MPAESLTVGDVEITAILDVDTWMPLTEVFDGTGDPLPGGLDSLATRYPEEFTDKSWRFRAHCFLVRAPSRLTLIDTGVGPLTRPSDDGSVSAGGCRMNLPRLEYYPTRLTT